MRRSLEYRVRSDILELKEVEEITERERRRQKGQGESITN